MPTPFAAVKEAAIYMRALIRRVSVMASRATLGEGRYG